MNQRILITGGAGFIGSHLAEKYLNLGRDVYIIDDLSTGSLDNIKHLSSNADFDDRFFVTSDTIFNEEKMQELIGTCNIVIHLAAAVGVKYIIQNPLSSITTNVLGTEIVLRLCNKFKKKVLLASTSEAYGKQDNSPLREDDDVTFGSSGRLRWCYAVGKLMDEFAGIAYQRAYKLPVIVARLFNTVGPRQTGEYGMVVPRFIQQALKNVPITIYGDGMQTRTFTHVSEVCDCIISLVDKPGACGEVVNIGGVEEVSIKDLAERIVAKLNSKSELVYIPYEKVYTLDFEDMPRRAPDLEKLKSIIGFAPTMKLDEILDKIMEHHNRS